MPPIVVIAIQVRSAIRELKYFLDVIMGLNILQI
jgi:hypothetical protein